MFGLDLHDFFYACEIAEICEYDLLVMAFDGWALGAYFYIQYAKELDALFEGFCLPDYSCVGVYLDWVYGGGSSANTYTFVPLSWTVDSEKNKLALNYPLPTSASRSDYEMSESSAMGFSY